MRVFASLLLAVIFCTRAQAHPSESTVFEGGTIITMEGDAPATVEAVAMRDGKIIAAGPRAAVEEMAGKHARQVDLKGRTMLPGFIDAHGHVSGVGRFARLARLKPPPLGNVDTIARLQEVLRNYASQHPDGVLVGFGYDDSQLAERRHPTRHDLDAVSATRPILALHVSLHLAVANSPMLALLGFGPDTPDPAGGHIRRESDGRTPNGVLEEAAAMAAFMRADPVPPDQGLSDLVAGEQIYASYGITTAQEGFLPKAQWPMIAAAQKAPMPIDVTVLLSGFDDWPASTLDEIGKPYSGHVRIAGLKFILDGSPQGRTAWLSKPYFVVPDGKPADYRGYPGVDPVKFEQRLEQAAAHGWQVFAHVNGDAAMDMLIDGVRKAGLSGHRTIAIHSQIVRPEQLSEMEALDIQPSFFASHTWYWGDWHRDVVLGPERADFISPQASAWRAGLRPTAHNDSPVVPPDIMRLIWSSVTRRTQSGDILGPGERIPVYRALQQVTINAAWQVHEEDSKGSIAPGKRADFVVLDRDPLTVAPDGLLKTRVVATIKDGKTVFGSL